ncbi:MAG: TAXI family TRAP transporter solute-binding subunit [Gammaproteobacteria bacterium]|nr:TAXI family TRAP transporter solute-binding subunit [Gammaproteobacteria bacterium]
MYKIIRLLGLVLTLYASSTFAQQEQLQVFRIGTGGTAGTYYPIGGVIAQAISNPPGDRPCDQGGSCGPPGLLAIAQSSNGSVANVEGIQRGTLESGFVQSDVAHWAYTGTGIFKDKPPVHELRAIANLYPESIHIVIRKDSGITSINDLIGKRISLDEPGSGTLIDAELVLHEFGLTSDNFNAEYVKPDLAIERIRENRLDAFFIVAGYPTSAISSFASNTSISLLPITGPHADNLRTRFPYFSTDSIPDGTYQGVSQVETLSVGAQWLVAASVDAEVVYGITRALWHLNTRTLLDNGHAKGKFVTLESALEGISIPLHSGAARFYQEMGMGNQ